MNMAPRSNSVFHIAKVVVLVSLLLIETSGNIYGQCINDGNLLNCSSIGLVSPPEGSEIPQYKEVLDLSNNKISNVTFLDYAALADNLLILNLSNNEIHVLNKDAFMLLKALRTLDLSGNLITGDHLEENNFCDLNHLETLNMSKNPLRIIRKHTFDFMELGAITFLDLSHSEINVIESESMDLPSLKRLDLSWNKLQTFEEKFFKMMVNLLFLDLSHNQIAMLTEISYMPALTTLVLDFNDIQEIQVRGRMEYYTDKLERLYLRNNDVVFFNETSLPLELEGLKVIDMSNNKLQCDCNMKWIREDTLDFEGKNYTFPCDHPTRVKGKELLMISRDDLICGYDLVIILSSVAIATVVLLTTGLVLFFLIRRCRRKRKQQRNKKDSGGKYTAVYTCDDEDVRVTMADDKHLLQKDQEFDV